MNYCNCPNCRTENCPNATKPDAANRQRIMKRPDEKTQVGWRKTCGCESASSTNQIRTATKTEHGACTLTATFCPMPSCDKCGTPWEQESPANDPQTPDPRPDPRTLSNPKQNENSNQKIHRSCHQHTRGGRIGINAPTAIRSMRWSWRHRKTRMRGKRKSPTNSKTATRKTAGGSEQMSAKARLQSSPSCAAPVCNGKPTTTGRKQRRKMLPTSGDANACSMQSQNGATDLTKWR